MTYNNIMNVNMVTLVKNIKKNKELYEKIKSFEDEASMNGLGGIRDFIRRIEHFKPEKNGYHNLMCNGGLDCHALRDIYNSGTRYFPMINILYFIRFFGRVIIMITDNDGLIGDFNGIIKNINKLQIDFTKLKVYDDDYNIEDDYNSFKLIESDKTMIEKFFLDVL